MPKDNFSKEFVKGELEYLADVGRGVVSPGSRETFIAQQAKLVADQGAEIVKLREALKLLLVPYRDALRSGTPSGVYVQRFRFEAAEHLLKPKS
jgi:hypothetical protein